MFVAFVFLEKDFILEKASGRNIFHKEIQVKQQLDEVQALSETTRHENVLERMNSSLGPPTVLVGNKSCNLSNSEVKSSSVASLKRTSRPITVKEIC